MQRGSAADPLTGPVNADNATQSHFQGDRVARRVWLNVHRWFGLKLSILMSFILITGTLATVSHEIDFHVVAGAIAGRLDLVNRNIQTQ